MRFVGLFLNSFSTGSLVETRHLISIFFQALRRDLSSSDLELQAWNTVHSSPINFRPIPSLCLSVILINNSKAFAGGCGIITLHLVSACAPLPKCYFVFRCIPACLQEWWRFFSQYLLCCPNVANNLLNFSHQFKFGRKNSHVQAL